MDCSWAISVVGMERLAVVFENSIQVYLKDVSDWVSIAQIDFKFQIHSASWIFNNYSLLVSTDEGLVISRIDIGNERIADILRRKIESFPGYHLKTLTALINAGRWTNVRHNLLTLYIYTKIAVERGQDTVTIPINLWATLADKSEHVPNTGIQDLFLDAVDSGVVFKQDFGVTHLQYLLEHVPSMRIEALNEKDQSDLLLFAQAFLDTDQHRKSMDDNGIRYLILAKMSLRNSMDASPRDSAWAYYSESHDYLLSTINQYADQRMVWSIAKSLSMGWWIRNPETLRRQIELMARNQFLSKDGVKDPTLCALFQLALRKKNVLVGLWKISSLHPEQTIMLKFLSNDFEQERWQNAALKNAFALLGKQRFEYAASFFLLAGKLQDAVSVCIKQLNDPQLALVICRLYEGENGPVFQNLVVQTLIPLAESKQDRWSLSILYTLIKDREQAFYCLSKSIPSSVIEDPSLVVLYQYLQNHYKSLIMAVRPALNPTEEHEFILQCAASYDSVGCTALAIKLIKDYRLEYMDGIDRAVKGDEERLLLDLNNGPAPKFESELNKESICAPVNNQTLDWGVLPIDNEVSLSTGIDWGEMGTTFASEKLDFDEIEIEAEVDFDFSDQEILKTTEKNDQNMKVEDGEYKLMELERTQVRLFHKMLVIKLIQVTER